jgi:hypothetical protein
VTRFDEEPEDIHGECRAEIERLRALARQLAEALGHNGNCSCLKLEEWFGMPHCEKPRCRRCTATDAYLKAKKEGLI